MSVDPDSAEAVEDGAALPRMYTEFAGWWPILSAPEDYAEEAALYRGLILSACPDARTLLELGSGGRNNASHLKAHFELTLVDRSPAMLTVSRGLNPECTHLQGDMRDVRLEQTFDAVFVHDAVGYMLTEGDLAQAMAAAFVHCRPGGVALFVPDTVTERFQAATGHGGHDGEGRAMRYLEWTHDADPGDTQYVTDFAYLLRDVDGTVQVAHDHHVLGLFPRATWLRLLEAAGFQPRMIPLKGADWESEAFLGTKAVDAPR